MAGIDLFFEIIGDLILKKIAILSLDPTVGGGVLHSLLAAHKYCRQYFEPTVFFLDFDPRVSANLKKMSFRSSVSSKKLFGMDCRAIGARWAFWEPGHYAWTLEDWAQELSGFHYFFVSSGTGIAAHPLALLDKKFVAWIATPISGDREGKSFLTNPIRMITDAVAWPKMLDLEREILSKASFLLAMSSYAKKEFERIVQGANPPMEICGYPLDQAFCGEIDLKQDSGRKICLSIARFSDPRKDALTLLRAWELVSKRVPEAVLELVGTPPADRICRKFKTLIDEGKIRFVGTVDQDKKLEILSRSSLAIISSLQEGLGIAGLEAASFGLPIVSTDCGGPSDYVLDGLTGFIVPVGDYEAMADRIVQLLKDKKLSAKMGSKAKVLTGYFYSQEMIYNKFAMAFSYVWPELSSLFPLDRNKKVKKAQQISAE